jgi:release factor glutamine methyltransferase
MSVVEFAGVELATRPGFVMTPRTTSLALVDLAIAYIGQRPCRVADVGTGSGAIAIAIAKRAPRALIWAIDQSPDAVALATENADRAGVAGRVRVRQGDLLTPVRGQLDLVVANLPYLPVSERDVHRDLAFDPPDAVFAAGDGKGEYRRLLWSLRSRLRPGGFVALQYRRKILTASAAHLGELEVRLRVAAA